MRGIKPNPGGGVLKMKTLELTAAQLQAAQATASGYEIVPAVPGSILVPTFFSWDEDRNAAWTSTPTFQLVRASDNSSPNGGMTIGMQAGANNPVRSVRWISPTPAQINLTTTLYIGIALNVRLSAALTGAGGYTRSPRFSAIYFELPAF